MQGRKWTDSEIIKAIKGGFSSRNEALRYVFERRDWKSLTIRYIVKLGGLKEDAEEIANDTLIAFDKNIRNTDFKGKSALQTYFLSIAHKLWLSLQRRKKLLNVLDDQKLNIPIDDKADDPYREEKIQTIKRASLVLGERCIKLFQLKSWGYAGDAIAVNMGLKNSNMVKNRRQVPKGIV